MIDRRPRAPRDDFNIYRIRQESATRVRQVARQVIKIRRSAAACPAPGGHLGIYVSTMTIIPTLYNVIILNLTIELSQISSYTPFKDYSGDSVYTAAYSHSRGPYDRYTHFDRCSCGLMPLHTYFYFIYDRRNVFFNNVIPKHNSKVLIKISLNN